MARDDGMPSFTIQTTPLIELYPTQRRRIEPPLPLIEKETIKDQPRTQITAKLRDTTYHSSSHLTKARHE